MSRCDAENGEHGPTDTRTIAPGARSWYVAMSASVPMSACSVSSTTESGGSPPPDSPRSIEPRTSCSRMPTRPAAPVIAAFRSPLPRG